MKIVVAVHPKVEYQGTEFGKRQIAYFKTRELVENSLLVLAHATTAISFIVMYQKPFVF